MKPSIRLQGVSVRYENASVDSLTDIDLMIAEGEVVLVTGCSGCGKSTLLSVVNGLVPHLHGAQVRGEVEVVGLDPQQVELAETGKTIATVFQNPRTQFFCDDSTAEMAFALENAGADPVRIRQRIADTSEQLGVQHLLDRSMSRLSGGQKQQVALASCVAREPRLFVLDEPTSNLDAVGVRAVRELLVRLRSEGATVLICEHRLSFLAGLVDRVVILDAGRVVEELSGEDFFALPDDDPRRAGLRSSVPLERPVATAPAEPAGSRTDGLVITDLAFRYGRRQAPTLVVPNLALARGAVTAVVGSNGVGKSTLIRVLSGLSSRFEGEIRLDGRVMSRKDLRQHSYVVMQDVNRQLFAATVSDEVRLGARPDADVEAILASLGLAEFSSAHPQALSGGQRQRLAIATAEASQADVVLFDEPTSGLDLTSMVATGNRLRRLADDGRVVVVVTHDEELIAHCADVVVRLGEEPTGAVKPETLEGSGAR